MDATQALKAANSAAKLAPTRSALETVRQRFTYAGLVIEKDQQEMFELVERGLRTEVQPRGCLEETLFARLLHATWNLHTIKLTEASLLDDPLGLEDTTYRRSLRALLRYRRETERSYSRVLRHLREQQTLRLTAERIGHTLQQSPEEVLPSTADLSKVKSASGGR